ncbi:MAG: GlsB/YeaQ/YmgE family stress response membrane protein [Clostridia bacterium]|nr:GlsB/YeaQ/YmgE family stress response membrane protein [Clostridia bacterium]
MVWQIIVELAIGALCGFIAGKIMNSKGGLIKDILLGLVGGVVGGVIGSLIGVGGGWVTGILLSIGGACLVIWLFRLIFKK